MLSTARRRLKRIARPVVVAVLSLAAVAAPAAGAMAWEPGVDVSRYQHSTSLDWAKVQADGVEFAFIKATEGRTYTNPYFADDWAATTGLGLYRGAYHFARPGKGTAAAQATYFVDVAGLADQPGDRPPVLDLETSGGMGMAALRRWTSTFLTTVESLTGRTPVIYCSPYFWRTYLGDSTAFTRYPLWVAHYTNAAEPSLPGGWTTWTFWQNTSSGRVNGISGNVDEDRFNGSLEDLQALAQVPADPAPAEPTEPAEPVAPEPVATTTTLSAPASAVYAGQSVTFTATVLTGDGGVPVASRTVALARRPAGSTSWERVETATTDADGHAGLVAVPAGSAAYRARLLGDSAYRSSSSAPVDVTMLGARPTRLTIGRTAARVRPGRRVTVYGHLTLAGEATGVAGERVVLLGRVLGTSVWRRVGAGTSVAPTGWWQVAARPRRPHAYKAVYRGSSAYAAAHSTQVSVRIRR
jgi:GH25 family lysozyme M1 (1,4-beta-N-acetylmuramidase)